MPLADVPSVACGSSIPAASPVVPHGTCAAACWKVGLFLLNSKSVGSFANSREFLYDV